MSILETISWAPDGPEAPAYLYNVNRVYTGGGRATMSDIAQLPSAALASPDASVAKIRGERSDSPLFPESSVHDSKQGHIQFDAEKRSALEQARGDSRREEKADPDFCEFEDIRIEMPVGETSVDDGDAETQGLIQRLLANSVVSYFLKKSAIVFPGFTAFDHVVAAVKQSMDELVARFYTESPENAFHGRSTEERKQAKVSSTAVAPRIVQPDVRRDKVQVAPVFCVESQEDAALRRAREVHKVKFQGHIPQEKLKVGRSSSVML